VAAADREEHAGVLVDVYNITNWTNFENPINTVAGADRRLTGTFFVPTLLRGGSGFPR
jgi:hypothetical protein